MNTKQPKADSRSIASFLVLVIPLAFVAYVDIEPKESTPSTRDTRDPQTNRLRYVSVAGFTEEDYKRHIDELNMRIKKKLAVDVSSGGTGGSADQFSIVVEKPFVVIGDEAESVVKERAEGTLKWAVSKLKQDCFSKHQRDSRRLADES